MKSITLPASLTSIGERAFLGCSSVVFTVASANKSFSVSSEGALLSKDAAKGAISIPDSVNKIDSLALYGTPITSAVIPESVTVIGENAFCTWADSFTVQFTYLNKSDLSDNLQISAGCKVIFANGVTK